MRDLAEGDYPGVIRAVKLSASLLEWTRYYRHCLRVLSIILKIRLRVRIVVYAHDFEIAPQKY